LIDCPPVTHATYVLVAPQADGGRRALHVGVATSTAPTLNLAHIRRRGARLGAKQVHVMLHGPQAESPRRIARDLRARLLQP
jgi:hypothetical protein